MLRQEHREKERRRVEEAEKLRQVQLAQKLEVLRQQKQVVCGGCVYVCARGGCVRDGCVCVCTQVGCVRGGCVCFVAFHCGGRVCGGDSGDFCLFVVVVFVYQPNKEVNLCAFNTSRIRKQRIMKITYSHPRCT